MISNTQGVKSVFSFDSLLFCELSYFTCFAWINGQNVKTNTHKIVINLQCIIKIYTGYFLEFAQGMV